MSDHNSVDLNKLKTAIDKSSEIIGGESEGLRSELSTLVTLYTEVLSRCEVQKAEQVGLTNSESLLDQWASTDSHSQLVHDEVSPDQGGDIATFNGNPILDKLETENSDRTDISADPGELLGMPPTSGYADDPVCTANGNFVQQETDIEFFGFAELIDVQRTYNSLASTRHGVFGLGWTSMLDMLVTESNGEVRVRMDDGADVPLLWNSESDQFNSRRGVGLTLKQLGGDEDASGWFLESETDQSWTFNTQGQLIAASCQFASFIVSWSENNTTVAEQRSGRSVRYQFNEQGLVNKATSSDGRQAVFSYDSDGNCLSVDRPSGATTYTIENGVISSIIDADGVVLVANTYNRAGQVLSQTNEHGSISTYEYLPGGMTRVIYGSGRPANLYGHDGNGNLTSIFGGDGGAMRLWWDDRSRLTRVIERSGAETRYEYDADRPGAPLLRRIDPDGLETSFQYDDVGRIVSQTGRAGHTEHFVYVDDQLKPSRVVQADGTEISIERDEFELPVSYTDADGVCTQLLWDTDGQLVAAVSPGGARTTIVYDQVGYLNRVSDRGGVEMSFKNDDAGRIRSMTNPDGTTSCFTYTSAGRVVSCDADGPGSWSLTYTPSGALQSFVDSCGLPTSFTYDEFGRQLSHSNSDGSTWSQEYDAAGRIVKTIDPLGAATYCEFGRDGHVRARTESDGSRTEQVVDLMGRTTKLTYPDGLVSHWTYHPNGEIASHTDSDGNTTTFDIDEVGRLIAETAHDGSVTSYEYSPGGRLTAVTSPAGRRRSFAYNDAGELAEVIDADGNSEHVTYRPDGRMSAYVSGGTSTEITYDQAGRVNGWSTQAGDSLSATLTATSAEVSHNGNSAATFKFDSRQRLASVFDPAGVGTEFISNRLGQLSEVTTLLSSVSFSYDEATNVQGITDPLGVVTSFQRTPSGIVESVALDDDVIHRYVYDSRGRMVGINDADGAQLSACQYDHGNRIVQATNENGTVELKRDLHGRIVASSGLAGSAVTYARDADGMVTERSDNSGTVTYLRSASGALTGFSDPVVGDINVPTGRSGGDADAWGRIKADEQGRTFRYDTAGRLQETLSSNGQTRTFTYNDYGLLATDTTPEFGRRRFTYDQAGAVVRIESNRGVSTELSYDRAGRRLAEVSSDGSSISFMWNELSQLVRITRVDAAGVSETTNIMYSAFGRVERVDGVDVGWDDGIYQKPVVIGADRYIRWGGHVRRCVPDADWSDGTYDDPFGMSAITSKVTLGFRGELTVAGLVFMGDRVYDPVTRSFLSRDPLPPVPGKLSFAGLYSFAYNDPINFLDPSGRRPLSEEDFQTVRENLEKTAFEQTGEFLWEHRDFFKGVIVGAVAIAAAAAFCAGTVGVGCVIMAGAAAGGVTMLALDGGEALALGEEYGFGDAAWSLAEGAVVGGASAFGGTFLARSAAPLGLAGRAPGKPTVGLLGVGWKLARNPVTTGARWLGNPTTRSALATGVAKTIAVDGGLTFTGRTALDTIRYGQPQWNNSSFIDWIN